MLPELKSAVYKVFVPVRWGPKNPALLSPRQTDTDILSTPLHAPDTTEYSPLLRDNTDLNTTLDVSTLQIGRFIGKFSLLFATVVVSIKTFMVLGNLSWGILNFPAFGIGLGTWTLRPFSLSGKVGRRFKVV